MNGKVGEESVIMLIKVVDYITASISFLGPVLVTVPTRPRMTKNFKTTFGIGWKSK